MVVVSEVFFKSDVANLILLGSQIAFVVVPYTPPPPVKQIMGLCTPAVCALPLLILSVAIAVAIVVLVVVALQYTR